MNNINQAKRKMTLDLQNKSTSMKKLKVIEELQTPKMDHILTSPDVNKLKLGSPELDQFIISNQSFVSTTPTQIFFPKNVTEEQEQYAKGFVDALTQLQHPSSNNNNLHNLNNNMITTVSSHPVTTATATLVSLNSGQMNGHSHVNYNDSSNDSMTDPSSSCDSSHIYVTNGQIPIPVTSHVVQLQPVQISSASNHLSHPNVVIQHHRLPDYNLTSSSNYVNDVHQSVASPVPSSVMPETDIKLEEPQTVPSMTSSPSTSPINMAEQEKIKLERKRQRNRLAASKCRKRKLERIAKLEEKVKLLKGENSELSNVAAKLRESVCQLKQQVMEHVNSGCQIMISSNIVSLQ